MDDRRTTSGRTLRRQATRGLWLGTLATALALTGCFELIRSARVSQVCTPEAARRAGERDARGGAPARESYGQICGVAEPSLNEVYKEAYSGVPDGERAQPGFFRRLLH